MVAMPTDPSGQRKLLIALLPLLMAGVYYYGWHRKTVAEIARLSARQEELKARNDVARTRSNPEASKATKLKLAVYEHHARRLEQLIPRREQVPEMLYNVTERAQEAGVDHALIKPESEMPGEFYTEQTYAMRVVGTYHAIGRFLTQIGSLPRIITATQLTMTMPPSALKSRAPGMPVRLQADFKIQTYIIPTEDPLRAPPPVATTTHERAHAK